MAKKKDFSNGLASLFGEAAQNVTEKQPKKEGSEDEIQAALQRLHGAEPGEATQEENELINSLEDPELREELKRRLDRKKKIGRGRPRKNNDQLGRPTDGYDRTSLIIPKEKWAKIKEIAFIETLTMKEIVELALDLVIERYEAKHGVVTPKPERKKRDINEIF